MTLEKIFKGISNPNKILPYLRRNYYTIEGSIIFWPWRGQVNFESFELPKPGPKEILIENYVTLVSPGTERAFFNHLPNAETQYPSYPGYSGAGKVILRGDKISRFNYGDRVAVKSGHASLVLATEDQVFPIPDSISLDQAAFTQLFVIAMQGIRRAELSVGDKIAIFGQGLVGQLATQLAVASGAYPVTAIAASHSRQEYIRHSGANGFISLEQESDALAELAVDVVIEASGNPNAISLALQCTRPGGRVVLLGSTRGVCQDLDLRLIEQKRLNLVGAHIDSLPEQDAIGSWWPMEKEVNTFWRLLESGRLNVDALITDHIFPPEAEWFYRRLSRGEKGIMAALFRWDKLPRQKRVHPRSFLIPISETNGQQTLNTAIDTRQLLSSSVQLPTPKHPLYDAPRKETFMPSSNSMLKVGLIGCGEIATQNAEALHEAANATIAIAMDVQERVAKDLGDKYHVPFTTNIDDILASDVDAVLISTPHYLHAPLAIQALEAGKHVMVEKPMALTADEARHVIKAAERANVKLSTIYCQRFQPHIQRAKELILQGALGQVLGVSLFFQMDKATAYWTGGYSGRVTTDWRASKEKSGGGIFIFSMVHNLDIIHYLTGLKVRHVSSEYDTLDSPAETEDTISVNLRYDNKAIGVIYASTCVRGVEGLTNLQIWGVDGHLKLDETSLEFFSLRQIGAYEPSSWHAIHDLPPANDRTIFMTRFADAVLSNRQVDISAEDNLEIQLIVDAVYACGRLQRSVKLI